MGTRSVRNICQQRLQPKCLFVSRCWVGAEIRAHDAFQHLGQRARGDAWMLSLHTPGENALQRVILHQVVEVGRQQAKSTEQLFSSVILRQI